MPDAPCDGEAPVSADEEALVDGLNGSRSAAVVRQLFSRRNHAPSMLSVMASSLNIVQDRLTRSRLAGEPPDATITPKLGNIGLLQFDRAADSIAAGEQAVEEVTPALKEAVRRLPRAS
jgi:NTE family protein